MLHDFIATNRAGLISLTRAKVSARAWPSASTHEVQNGVPLFLAQVVETLRSEVTGAPFSSTAIGSTATKHGHDLLNMGFTVSQVVHDYGDVCQAITELAVEKKAAISAEEFHTLNRCLDTAIAAAAMLLRDGTAHVQAGAGIVADSDADAEDTEARNKAAAVLRAIAVAGTFRPVAG